MTNNYKFSLFEKVEKWNHHIVCHDKKIDEDYIAKEKIEFIISYNYKYLIPNSVVSKLKNRIVNLHISYLPFNRGAHPNVWSFLDDTPKGVSIHCVDEGIDTGDILLQKEIFFNEDDETFETTYVKLNQKIKLLFLDNVDPLLSGILEAKKQNLKEGTYHKKKDIEPILEYFGDSFWNTKIGKLKRIIKERGLYVGQ